MTLRTHTFEGQTDGVTVTQANSDDFGDPQFSAVSITGTAGPPTVKYATLHPVVGLVGVRVFAAVGDVGLFRGVVFNPLATQAALQVPFYAEGLPSATAQVVGYRHGTGPLCALNCGSDGKFLFSDGAAANRLIAATALPTATDLILDVWAKLGSTNANGGFKWQLRKKSDLSVIASGADLTGANTNNAALALPALASIQVGKLSSAGSIPGWTFGEMKYDDGASDFIPFAAVPLDFTIDASPLSGNVPFNTTLTIGGVAGGSGTAVTFTIDWADGSSTTGPAGSYTHTYASAKAYEIAVTGQNS